MSDHPAPGATRCGYVAVIGAPNVGKSTLVNRMVGAKVSIVSPKVQTTRMRVLGIAIEGQAEIIFVDTPGIFTPRRRLDRAMVAAAWTGARDADVILLLVDAGVGCDDDTRRIVDDMITAGRPAVLAINKVDSVARETLLGLAASLNRERLANGTPLFSDTFMISALTGDGVETVKQALAKRLPEGPWLYPEDDVTDVPLRLLAAEITREKLYLMLKQELPYASTVETETWQERDDGSVRIEQVILVERPGQKAIVLGKGGQMVKAIGAAARAELETMLGHRVHLFLYVKVSERWAEERGRFRDLGLDFDA
ncbi:MAG: GTPase Era [Alphaproteobacteria bacterium]